MQYILNVCLHFAQDHYGITQFCGQQSQMASKRLLPLNNLPSDIPMVPTKQMLIFSQFYELNLFDPCNIGSDGLTLNNLHKLPYFCIIKIFCNILGMNGFSVMMQQQHFQFQGSRERYILINCIHQHPSLLNIHVDHIMKSAEGVAQASCSGPTRDQKNRS